MKFVSLISRPLGHPAALCFSRLAGLNRRPQSCRTKFIEEWHFSGQLWTHYIWHHFNWEKIGALPILSQENHISCCFLYISGIFQGIWLNSNNQTNLLQNSRANTSQGINCISAADTKEFGPQNRAGIFLSTKARCHRPRTPDSLQGSGPFFSPKLWLAGFGRNLTEKKTWPNTQVGSFWTNKIPLQSTFWASNAMLFSVKVAVPHCRLSSPAPFFGCGSNLSCHTGLRHGLQLSFAATILLSNLNLKSSNSETQILLAGNAFLQIYTRYIYIFVHWLYVYTYIYVRIYISTSWIVSPITIACPRGWLVWVSGGLVPVVLGLHSHLAAWSSNSMKSVSEIDMDHDRSWLVMISNMNHEICIFKIQIQSFDSIQYSSVLFMWLRFFSCAPVAVPNSPSLSVEFTCHLTMYPTLIPWTFWKHVKTPSNYRRF